MRKLLGVALACMLIARPAYAQQAEQPPSPSTLPSRQASFTWDKTLLRAGFSYRDAIDPVIAKKIDDGLVNVIAMRAYVFRDGSTTPVALAVRTCRVVYDIWDEVYRITLAEPGKKELQTAVLTIDGVRRLCAEAKDLLVVDRSLLTAGTPHFLAIVVDVNPVSPQMLDQMRRWMSRPAGSTNLSPTDGLFGSFVGLFARQIGKSDKTVTFRTQGMVP